MKKANLIKLLRAMAENSRAVGQNFINDSDNCEDKAFGDKMIQEARVLEDAARLIERDDYARKIWAIYFPAEEVRP